MQEGRCVMAGSADDKPAAVPVAETTAKQAGSCRARWAWSEPSIWTERMLAALEKGVKGGKWFSLIDKVYALPTLRAAWAKVQANAGAAGIDAESVQMFERRAEEHLQRLYRELWQGTYEPLPVLRTWIDKLGSSEKRPLGIPAVRDRIVQTALRFALEPIWEARFAEHSYGFRPGRGCKDALRRVDGLLRAGFTWVVDADLKGFFDSIPHDRLLAEVKQCVSDGRVLQLIEAYLNAKVMDGLQEIEPEQGTPQGAVISPLLANIYLNEMDHTMAQAGFAMVRYADDFVILCRTQAEAERALELVRQWVESRGLILHPNKTKLVDATQKGGFDFLGYHFERGMHWPRKKSLNKLKDRVRELTPRKSGKSLSETIQKLNRTLHGWFQYFKHSYHTTYHVLDSWIRMRLRSLLRKRQGRQGRGRGTDHWRWPNAYFANLGLFNLTRAHQLACQSL